MIPRPTLDELTAGDRLHPGDEGNRAMADAVDLDALLAGVGTTSVTATTASVKTQTGL